MLWPTLATGTALPPKLNEVEIDDTQWQSTVALSMLMPSSVAVWLFASTFSLLVLDVPVTVSSLFEYRDLRR
jgi:hypothetical protein